MKRNFIFPFFVIAILLEIFGPEVQAFGFVDYNDECEFVDLIDPVTYVSHVEEWKYCDTRRGLHCVPGLGRCGCSIPLTIYRAGKCRAKINSGCIIKDYKLECVEFATCTRNSSSLIFKCKCNRGYLPNYELTSCFPTESYQRRYRYRDGYYFANATSLGSQSMFVFLILGLIIVFLIH